MAPLFSFPFSPLCSKEMPAFRSFPPINSSFAISNTQVIFFFHPFSYLFSSILGGPLLFAYCGNTSDLSLRNCSLKISPSPEVCIPLESDLFFNRTANLRRGIFLRLFGRSWAKEDYLSFGRSHLSFPDPFVTGLATNPPPLSCDLILFPIPDLPFLRLYSAGQSNKYLFRLDQRWRGLSK